MLQTLPGFKGNGFPRPSRARPEGAFPVSNLAFRTSRLRGGGPGPGRGGEGRAGVWLRAGEARPFGPWRQNEGLG